MTERETVRARSVRQIQTALDFISRLYPDLPPLVPDGIYGPATAEAVRAFQALIGLPPTGEVDFATWNAISAVYGQAKTLASPALGIFPFPELAGLTTGDAADVVYLAQVMLRSLATQVNTLSAPSLTGVLDTETTAAIRAFQTTHFLPQSGIFDRETWDALATAYNRYLLTEG